MSKAITKNKIQKSRQDKMFDFIIYAVAVLLIVITVYPMYFIVIASISNPTDVSSGNISLLAEGNQYAGI